MLQGLLVMPRLLERQERLLQRLLWRLWLIRWRRLVRLGLVRQGLMVRGLLVRQRLPIKHHLLFRLHDNLQQCGAPITSHLLCTEQAIEVKIAP
jgi:hypothetical protein